MSGCADSSSHASLQTSDKTSSSKPNVIVMIVDDAGYNDFSFMDSQEMQTPHIDQLASQGVVFTDAHTSGTVCAPSRAGLMAGRYQHRFGFSGNLPGKTMSNPNLGIPASEYTLANLFQDNDYNTFAIGKWHLGAHETLRPNVRGFDEFYGFLAGHRSYFPTYDPSEGIHERVVVENNQPVEFEGYLTDVLADKAIDYIEQSKDEPFFMYYAPLAVHGPMHAKKEMIAKYKKQNHPRPILAAMTESLDDSVGRISQKLREENLMDNTVIIFLSDNGGGNYNNTNNFPLNGYKGLKFEGGHRVPFFISWPEKVNGGEIFNGLTSALDIYATSEAILGFDPQATKAHDGVNLLPFIRSTDVNASNQTPHEKLFWQKDNNASMRDGDNKLVVVGERIALFDLSVDIGESNDISKQHPARVARMLKELQNWYLQFPQPRWKESNEWAQVTVEKHLAILETRKAKFKTPEQLRKYLSTRK